MKNTNLSICYTILMVAFTSIFPSCTDWTDPESLDIHSPSLEEDNPQLYEDYLKDLRRYKSGEHKITILSFENPQRPPVKQAEHLTVLPDSADFVCLHNPNNINEVYMQEIEEVRNKKGTKTIYKIDYNAFDSEWTALQKEEGGDKLTEEDALAFFKKRTEESLMLCDTYNYDGIIVDYNGRSLVSLPEKELAIYNARQENFFSIITQWKESHKNKHLLFYGNVQYLFPERMSILSQYDYIILKTQISTNGDDLTVKALMAVQAGIDATNGEGENPVPTDRFIACVETPRPEDKEQVYGYWNTLSPSGEKTLATYGAAQWVSNVSADFGRKGIFILNSHNDYYDNAIVYGNIRESINIMNPNN